LPDGVHRASEAEVLAAPTPVVTVGLLKIDFTRIAPQQDDGFQVSLSDQLAASRVNETSCLSVSMFLQQQVEHVRESRGFEVTMLDKTVKALWKFLEPVRLLRG